MLRRLPIALAQLKAAKTSENLLNQFFQIMYSFYQQKKITENVFRNIMNSIKLENRNKTIFMSSKNSKQSETITHRLLLNLADKIDLTNRKICCVIKS